MSQKINIPSPLALNLLTIEKEGSFSFEMEVPNCIYPKPQDNFVVLRESHYKRLLKINRLLKYFIEELTEI